MSTVRSLRKRGDAEAGESAGLPWKGADVRIAVSSEIESIDMTAGAHDWKLVAPRSPSSKEAFRCQNTIAEVDRSEHIRIVTNRYEGLRGVSACSLGTGTVPGMFSEFSRTVGFIKVDVAMNQPSSSRSSHPRRLSAEP